MAPSTLRVHDLRSAATDPHRSVDDAPFGGGAGMVLAPEPLFGAVEAVDPPRPLYLLGPAGRRFDQRLAEELAARPGFSLLCGRYEGVDARVADHLCDDELSIGDYVLAGGEVAACVVVEAVTRLLPGVMGNADSAAEESFGASNGLLEHPQYTRPADFRGMAVPEVLRGGDHGRIARWRLAWRSPGPPSAAPICWPAALRRRTSGGHSTSTALVERVELALPGWLSSPAASEDPV